MENSIAPIAQQILLVADRIRNSAILTCDDMESADQLLWATYEAGVFPDDDLFAHAVNNHLAWAREPGADAVDGGFTDWLLMFWLPVRVPGSGVPYGEDLDKSRAEHGLRQIARLLLADKVDTKATPVVNLSPAEQDIIGVLQDAGHRLTRSLIFDALSDRGKIPSEGTTNTTLATLVRHGILTHNPKSKPSGYGLPEWTD